jgi:D-sedoheptulose 7-phosphate isomerase
MAFRFSTDNPRREPIGVVLETARASRVATHRTKGSRGRVGSLISSGRVALNHSNSDDTDSGHSERYFAEAAKLATSVDPQVVDEIARGIAAVRQRGGRLFVLGVGGGAGHASHAVNDFRKLCHIESYAPTDNVSELTARINDDGWDTALVRWLEISRLNASDGIMVFSVGGGSRARGVSVSIAAAIERAHEIGASIFGVVGSRDGVLAQLADACVVVEPPADLKTPLVESFQAVVWHALVSHPDLAAQQAHWESMTVASYPQGQPG